MKLFDELREIRKDAKKAEQSLLKEAPKEAEETYQRFADTLRRYVQQDPELFTVVDLSVRTTRIPSRILVKFHEKVLNLVKARLEAEGVPVTVLSTRYTDSVGPNAAETRIRVETRKE